MLPFLNPALTLISLKKVHMEGGGQEGELSTKKGFSDVAATVQAHLWMFSPSNLRLSSLVAFLSAAGEFWALIGVVVITVAQLNLVHPRPQLA